MRQGIQSFDGAWQTMQGCAVLQMIQ